MAIAELLLATTGILSTSIGAGIYLTGALHDIEQDPMLPRIKGLRLRARVRLDRMNKARLFSELTLKQLQQREASRKAHEEKLLAEANARTIVGPESRTQYDLRREGTLMVGKYLVGEGSREAPPHNAWYGHLRGVPLVQIISSYTRLPESRIYEAKVYEDKTRDGHVLSWIELGEKDRREMFLPNEHLREHLEIAR